MQTHAGSGRVPDELTWDDVPALMVELRDVARGLLGADPGSTLPTGSSTRSALRRLRVATGELSEVSWESRSRFFAAMRRALMRTWLDHARNERPLLGNLDVSAITLDPGSAATAPAEYEAQMAGLYHALESLDQKAPDEDVAIVHHRLFSGLTPSEIAHLMELDEDDVARRWRFARSWLHHQMVQFLEKA